MGTSEGSVFSGISPTGDNLSHFIIQLLLILLTTRILVVLLKPLKQPAVIAEVIAGILLGPSVLSRSAAFKAAIFPESSIPMLQLFANVALILFMFTVGLELDWKIVTHNLRKSVFVSLTGIVIPFGLGAAVSVLLYNLYATPTATYAAFVLFGGTAISITAFPVLARILSEMRLLQTHLGGSVMNAAAVDDVIAWSILALVIAISNASDGIVALYTILSTAAFLLVLGVFVRPVLSLFASRLSGKEHIPAWFFILSVMLCFLCAWTTQLLGVHFIFGAFAFGVAMPRAHNVHVRIGHRIEDLVVSILLPLYFTFSGLRTQFNTLNDGTAWGMVFLVIAAAVAGKFGGCSIAARISGMEWRDALTTGIFMNAKGLVELIVLNVGLDLGVLSSQVFSIFVFMALITTFMTVPLVNLVYPPDRIRADDRKRRDAAEAATAAALLPSVTRGETKAGAALHNGGDDDATSSQTTVFPFLRGGECLLLAATNPLDAAAMVSFASALLPHSYVTPHALSLRELARAGATSSTTAATALERALSSKHTPIILLHATLVSDRPSSYLRELAHSDEAGGRDARVVPVSLLVDSSMVAAALSPEPVVIGVGEGLADADQSAAAAAGSSPLPARMSMRARAMPNAATTALAARVNDRIQRLQFDFVIAMASERARALGRAAVAAMSVGVLRTADVRADIAEEAAVFGAGLMLACVHLSSSSSAPLGSVTDAAAAGDITRTLSGGSRSSGVQNAATSGNRGLPRTFTLGGGDVNGDEAGGSGEGGWGVVSSIVASITPQTLNDQLLAGLVAGGKPLVLLCAQEHGLGLSSGVLGPQRISRVLIVVATSLPEADREMLATIGHALTSAGGDTAVRVDVVCVDDVVGARTLQAAYVATYVPTLAGGEQGDERARGSAGSIDSATEPTAVAITLAASSQFSTERARHIAANIVRSLAMGMTESDGDFRAGGHEADVTVLDAHPALASRVQIVHTSIASAWVSWWVASAPADSPVDAVLTAGQRVETLVAAARETAARASVGPVAAAAAASPARPARRLSSAPPVRLEVVDLVVPPARDGDALAPPPPPPSAPPSRASSAGAPQPSLAPPEVLPSAALPRSHGSAFNMSVAIASTDAAAGPLSPAVSMRRTRASTLATSVRFGVADAPELASSPADFVPLPSASVRSSLFMRAFALQIAPALPRRTLSMVYVPGMHALVTASRVPSATSLPV